MKPDNKTITKVVTFLANEYINNVGDICIFKDEDGVYDLFNKYIITTNIDTSFTVESKTNYKKIEFSNLKNAFTWCVFDNKNGIKETDRIECLDKLLSSIDVSIDVHQRLVKRSKTMETKLIYLAKLNEDQLKRKYMLVEMASFMKTSKNVQSKKFEDKSKKK